MSRRQDLLNDPVVEEVRRWRAELQKEAGGTLEGLIKLINDRAAAREAGAKTASKPRRASKKSAPKGRAAPKRRRPAA